MAKNSAMRIGFITAAQFAAAMAIVLWPAGCWAQSGGPVFTPTVRQLVDARSAPAKVTGEEESALTSKGYLKIGTITAWQAGKKKTDAKQMESAILQKAAEAGGDIVRFSEEGALETTSVPTGKTKTERTCEQSKTVTVSAGQDCVKSCFTDSLGNTRCVNAACSPKTNIVERCVRWGEPKIVPVTQREKGLVSEGAVWRYDSKLVADIAREAEAERAAATAACPMLGKDINSAEMRTWLSNLGTPEIDRFDDGYFYSFKPQGVSLRFDKTDVLKSIIFYSEGADGFRQYRGDLPYGLSFQLTRKEIESVLGPPENSGGGAINVWTSYSSKGIGITYDTKRTDDLNARIHDMGFSM